MANFGVVTVVLAAVAAAAAASLPVAGITQSAERQTGSGESRIGDLLGKPRGWDLNAVDSKAKALSLLAEGQQPTGIKNWINTQLLPQAKQTAVEMQGQVDGAQQQIESCKDLLWSAEKEVKHRESILEQDESQRFQCIAEEHRLHKTEMDFCDDLKYLTDLVVKNQPASLSSLTNKTVDTVETVLRKNHQFVNDFYTKMLDKQSACGTAKQAAEDVHSQCQGDEDAIEEFYCSMSYGRDQSCTAYDACFKEKVAAFEKTEADVKELEAHTKDQFKKLTCFEHGIADGGGVPGSPDCDPATLNTAHLTVTYPVKPQAKTCIGLMKTRRDFGLVQCKLGQVVPKTSGTTSTSAPTTANETASTNTTAS